LLSLYGKSPIGNNQLNACLDAGSLYEVVIQAKPNFEIGLVNLANALKDTVCNFSFHGVDELAYNELQGRIEEAIVYYRRALEPILHLPRL
jgi:hypothetical protein